MTWTHTHVASLLNECKKLFPKVSQPELILLRPILKVPVWPIFEKRVREAVESSQPGEPIELQHRVQYIMAEATICIFFGQVSHELI